MNKMILKQIETINDQVQELEELLRRTSAELERVQKTNEKLVKEKWNDQKEINTMRRASAQFDELQGHFDDMNESHDALHERLQGLLAFSKALHESIRDIA